MTPSTPLPALFADVAEQARRRWLQARRPWGDQAPELSDWLIVHEDPELERHGLLWEITHSVWSAGRVAISQQLDGAVLAGLSPATFARHLGGFGTPEQKTERAQQDALAPVIWAALVITAAVLHPKGARAGCPRCGSVKLSAGYPRSPLPGSVFWPRTGLSHLRRLDQFSDPFSDQPPSPISADGLASEISNLWDDPLWAWSQCPCGHAGWLAGMVTWAPDREKG